MTASIVCFQPWKTPLFNKAYKDFIKEFIENINFDVNYNWSRVKNKSVNANHLCARFCKASAQPIKKRSRTDDADSSVKAPLKVRAPRPVKPKKPPKRHQKSSKTTNK